VSVPDGAAARPGGPLLNESGDRARFLARLRQRLVHGVPENPAHPWRGPLDGVPRAQSSLLGDDLVESFVRNATAARAVVHVLDAAVVPDDFLADVVARHDVSCAVASNEPEAQSVGQTLERLGVDVLAISVEASARADLGVTGAVAALATTGTVVQHAGRAGGRSASLLPPTHLCVLAASRIVASTAEVLRTLPSSDDGQGPPSNLVFVTGPSRSGDIEQIMALGVHGPVAIEVALLLQA
jgi:L-lactate utilization protein LutC